MLVNSLVDINAEGLRFQTFTITKIQKYEDGYSVLLQFVDRTEKRNGSYAGTGKAYIKRVRGKKSLESLVRTIVTEYINDG